MISLLIISVLLAVSFIDIAIRIEHGLPDSISAMVYVLPRQKRWLWIVWMWAVSLLTCIPLIEVMPERWKAFGFLTLGCLMFCGAMPISDGNVSKKAHDAFGILGGILSQACVAFLSPWWLAAWLLWLFCMGSTVIQPESGDMRSFFNRKGVFVAECVCLVTLIVALLEYFI